MRSLHSLIFSLLTVAVLSRWQTGQTELFEMECKFINNSRCTCILKLWETLEGADYHVQLPGLNAGGSGHLDAAKLSQFRLGLQAHHAWTLPSQRSRKDDIIIFLHQGDRNQRIVVSACQNTPMGEWLASQKSLLEACLRNAFLCPD